MRTLDPNDPDDNIVILGYLLEDEIERLGVEQSLEILMKLNKNDMSQKAIGLIGSEEELNCLLTDFHFTQQIIFDYYDIIES